MQQCKLYFTLNGKDFNLYFNYIKGSIVPKIEMIDKDEFFTYSERERVYKAAYRVGIELRNVFLGSASDDEKKYEVMSRVQKIMKSL